MKTVLTMSDMPKLISFMSEIMNERRQTLAALDSLTGDGDIGVTIALIFKSSQRFANTVDEDMEFSGFFGELSETVGENAPSTFGTFVATMLQSISCICGNIKEIDAATFASMLRTAAEGVMKRGGAKLGDKTLLDALIPASEAASKASTLPEAAALAAMEADKGAENTVALKATVGRAGYMGERSIGNKDPGAVAIAYMLTAINEFIVQQD